MTDKKIDYTSFSISILDNESGESKELLPISLENHPSPHARKIYELGFKLCKWLNNNNKKYAVSLDGSYIEIDKPKQYDKTKKYRQLEFPFN